MIVLPKHPEPQQAERLYTLGTLSPAEKERKCSECGRIYVGNSSLCYPCMKELSGLDQQDRS